MTKRSSKAKKGNEGKKINNLSYINVNRAKKGYRDKYRKDVEKAMGEYASKIGKRYEDFTDGDWRRFFQSCLIPLDKESEQKMIGLFSDNRDELNRLLVLHNTLASNNIAEVYYKKYLKESPTQWHDIEDFKQMALEGLAIAAKKFDPSMGNKFITFATWWVLNRVRKPYQERGAMVRHKSLDETVTNPQGDAGKSTLQEVLDPDDLEPSWKSPSEHTMLTVEAEREERMVDEDMNLFTTLKNLKTYPADGELDRDRVDRMVGYLSSLVERCGDYGKRQIFLYLFKRIFNKYSSSGGMESDDPSPMSRRLASYVAEAAKSKSDLLTRLNMDERQYEATCRQITRSGGYNGIQKEV